MERKYESYKIVIEFGMPQRRETEKGAMELADRLRKKGRHGRVEGVRYELDENGQIVFDLIREF